MAKVCCDWRMFGDHLSKVMVIFMALTSSVISRVSLNVNWVSIQGIWGNNGKDFLSSNFNPVTCHFNIMPSILYITVGLQTPPFIHAFRQSFIYFFQCWVLHSRFQCSYQLTVVPISGFSIELPGELLEIYSIKGPQDLIGWEWGLGISI